jgi:hypothetical protein
LVHHRHRLALPTDGSPSATITRVPSGSRYSVVSPHPMLEQPRRGDLRRRTGGWLLGSAR